MCWDHELGLQVEGVEQLDLTRRVGARVRQETVVTVTGHSAIFHGTNGVVNFIWKGKCIENISIGT